MSTECYRDPREALVRQKFFDVRPRPLQRWMWQQGLPGSAERVFWLHWQAGLQGRDWCSAIPLKTVARECALDISTVTRAYQLLSSLGLIRRQDPGRDPSRPFQQAVAITEVRLPRELIQQLDCFPNREQRRAPHLPEPAITAASQPASAEPQSSAPTANPFAAMGTLERRGMIGELTGSMSAGEKARWYEATRMSLTHMQFDPDTKLRAEQRAQVLQILSLMKPRTAAGPPPSAATARAEPSGPGRLSALELARLRRELQCLLHSTDIDESFRQVVWSVEEGALRRFTTLHAVRIALKKIREGQWTRPNRMPPQWSRALNQPGRVCRPTVTEHCTAA